VDRATGKFYSRNALSAPMGMGYERRVVPTARRGARSRRRGRGDAQGRWRPQARRRSSCTRPTSG
jgi:hypothetical protein